MATVQVLGRRLPLGGGGYFRLLPLEVIRLGIGLLERRGTPAVLYCHPHQFDPNALAEVAFRVPWRVRLHQGLGRSGFAGKMGELLDEFPFGPIRDMLSTEHPGGQANPGPL